MMIASKRWDEYEDEYGKKFKGRVWEPSLCIENKIASADDGVNGNSSLW